MWAKVRKTHKTDAKRLTNCWETERHFESEIVSQSMGSHFAQRYPMRGRGDHRYQNKWLTIDSISFALCLDWHHFNLRFGRYWLLIRIRNKVELNSNTIIARIKGNAETDNQWYVIQELLIDQNRRQSDDQWLASTRLAFNQSLIEWCHDISHWMTEPFKWSNCTSLTTRCVPSVRRFCWTNIAINQLIWCHLTIF